MQNTRSINDVYYQFHLAERMAILLEQQCWVQCNDAQGDSQTFDEWISDREFIGPLPANILASIGGRKPDARTDGLGFTDAEFWRVQHEGQDLVVGQWDDESSHYIMTTEEAVNAPAIEDYQERE